MQYTLAQLDGLIDLLAEAMLREITNPTIEDAAKPAKTNAASKDQHHADDTPRQK
jgi:hypothetical protein